MPYISSSTCEIKAEGFLGKFSGCKEKPVGICVYCGRAFCENHGETQDDGSEVCTRKNCIAKKDDLVVHLEYRQGVNEANDSGVCGEPSCALAPDGQCGRCRGFFCLRHIDTRHETVEEGRVKVERLATLCEHCWDRRPIWARK